MENRPELADDFRRGMRCFANSVCIVAARHGATRGGTTVTSVCSVSLSPPSLLVCINRTSSSRELLRQTPFFSLTVLSEADAALADVFAGRTALRTWEERFAFAGARWSEDDDGVPILEGAPFSAVCKRKTWLESGSHSVVIGDVQTVHRAGTSGTPLLYAHGSYAKLATAS